MSCLSQRSGRFTFKTGRRNSEIYLQQGSAGMQYSVRWKVKRLWPKFSGGDRAGSILTVFNFY
jgi:hypothetical protein